MQNHANSWKLLDVYEIIGARKNGLVVILGSERMLQSPQKKWQKSCG
jgi:hypothetical protein